MSSARALDGIAVTAQWARDLNPTLTAYTPESIGTALVLLWPRLRQNAVIQKLVVITINIPTDSKQKWDPRS